MIKQTNNKMLNPKHNLSKKKLTDFTSEDTIYMKYTKSERKPIYLCQFISYNHNKSVVTGKVIEVEQDYEKRIIGEIITARYDNCALYGNATDEENRSYYRWFDGSLYAMHPLEQHKIVANDLHVEKHPSYALARFSRISGGHRALFGSSIQSQQTITLTITRARHDRSSNNDWYYGQEELIEVEMSQNQFAELITSMNMGQGIPVTIRHINLERYPNPPFQSKADIFAGEFAKSMHNFTIDMKKLVEQSVDMLKNKATIGKGDRDVILKNIDQLVSHISSTIPFVSQQFQESMEKTVVEAKSEIEAFIENKIRTTGLEALGFKKEDNTPIFHIDNKE
jgi:hypothetical protein